MGLKGIAQTSITENLHQCAVAVDLSALSNVDDLFAFHQIGKQIHEGNEIGEFGENNNKFFISGSDGPGFFREGDDGESLILIFPLNNQVLDGSVVFETVELGFVEPIVYVIFF